MPPPLASHPARPSSNAQPAPEVVVVPAGTFIMGSPESKAGRLRPVYDHEGEAIEWTTQDNPPTEFSQ